MKPNNKLEIEKLFNCRTPEDNVCGSWYIVQWRPNVVSQERITVGIIFVHKNKMEHAFSFLSESQYCIYETIYGEKASFHISLAIDLAKEIVEHDSKLAYTSIERKMPHSGLGIEFGGMASGDDKKEIVNRLFKDIVLKEGML